MSDTPRTDAFIAALPPVRISPDVVTTGKSVRALMVAYAEHAHGIERDLHDARAVIERLIAHERGIVHLFNSKGEPAPAAFSLDCEQARAFLSQVPS